MLTKEDLEKNLERVHEWIKAADQKVSIFFAFQGIVLTILFPSTYSWLTNNLHNLCWLILCSFILGLILIIYSLYESVSAIIPRLTKNNGKQSLIYFRDVAKLDLRTYTRKLEQATPQEYEKDLAEQTHTCSKIAVRKYKQFRKAIISFFTAILLLALSFLFVKFL